MSYLPHLKHIVDCNEFYWQSCLAFFGGFLSALGYIIGGFVLCLTIVGFPFGLQCFKLAGFILWPFGREAVNTSSSGGCLLTLLNVVWIVCGGLYAAIIHIVFGLLLYITIIGIPFGKQHFKLVEVSLMPFGKRIVYSEDYRY